MKRQKTALVCKAPGPSATAAPGCEAPGSSAAAPGCEAPGSRVKLSDNLQFAATGASLKAFSHQTPDVWAYVQRGFSRAWAPIGSCVPDASASPVVGRLIREIEI